jgi:ribosome biogenesis SPOUT family RNA methylase Rps3
LTAKELPEISGKDDTAVVAKILRDGIEPSLDNICFMDMRAEKTLKTGDVKQFKFVVFGGILGDHPPQDRAMEFRSRFSHIRQLGKV